MHERPEPGPASEAPSKTGQEKIRGEHSINVHISYELKTRILTLAEKYDLAMADVVRQAVKAGLPVFESLSASQEELVFGFVQLLRKSRSMGELKK